MVVLFAGIPIVIVGVLLARLDVNGYRPEIGAALSERLGREVTLKGPIHWGFSPTSGIDLSVKDVIVANPAGSSRPVLAQIGRLSLAVALRPLWRHELDIESLDAADVSVHLDQSAVSSANGAPGAPASNLSAHPDKPLAFHVGRTSLKNATLVIQNQNGGTTTYKIDGLTLASKGSELELSAKGSVNGAPLELDVRGPKGFERVRIAPWPFAGKARYAGYNVKAKGTLDLQGKKIDLDPLTLTAGSASLAAKLAIAYGGARPVVRGNVSGDRLDLKDLERALPGGANAREASSAKPEAIADRKDLSGRSPVPFENLKAADVHLVVALGDVPVGKASFKQVHATVDLSDGSLSFSPVTALFAGGRIDGQIEFDAQKSPVRARAVVTVRQVELAQLGKIGGFHSLFEGRSDIYYDLQSVGGAARELASHVRGRINIVMGRGAMKASVLSGQATALLYVLVPGSGGNEASRVNCLAARFNVFGERMQSNGIILDTGVVTATGAGEVNLGDKTIDMVVNSRPKIPMVGSFTPAVRILGSLANPRFSVDAASYVQKAEGLLGGRGDFSGVPAVIPRDGQNACVDALDHPQAVQTIPLPGPRGVKKVLDRAGRSIDGLGGKILHGIGGAFGR
jgi:uncharacterized protein involved in outer membrane biogenesis